MDFIRTHLISKSLTGWSKLCREFDNNSWFYFSSPISDGNRVIDRIGKGLVYYEDEIIPANWRSISGGALLEICDQTLNRKLFFYKMVGSRRFKVKLK